MRPPKAARLRRFWLRSSPRTRFLSGLAASLGLCSLVALGFALHAWLAAPAPAPMAFGEYTAALARQEVTEVLVRESGAIVTLRDGTLREVQAPIAWQPVGAVAASGAAIRYEAPSPERLSTITSLLGFLTLLAFAGVYAWKMRGMGNSARQFTPGARSFADVAGQEEAKQELPKARGEGSENRQRK